jgi:parallel beta-helix repeat protein
MFLPALLLAAGSVLAAPPQLVTECGTVITEPGNYLLANDLVGCPDSGVSIFSSDVTLDLKGYTISCADNGLRLGGVMAWGTEDAFLQNVTIKNGGVTGCSDGILFAYVEDSKIWKMTSWGNRLWEGQSGTGITVWLSQNNVIMHNQTFYNEDAGIGSWESRGNLFKHNTSTDNYWGIWMGDDSDSQILCNRTWANGVGIVLGPGSNDNLVRGNVASYNFYEGISIVGFAWDGFFWQDIPFGNTVRKNIAENNLWNDLFEGYWELLWDEEYLHPDGTCLNTWKQNQYDGALAPAGCIGAPVVLDEDDVCALD